MNDNAGTYRILFFWASYCAPCNYMKRVELPKLTSYNIDISEIDCMKNPFLADEYSVKKLPHVVILRNDEVYWERKGGITPGELLISLCQD